MRVDVLRSNRSYPPPQPSPTRGEGARTTRRALDRERASGRDRVGKSGVRGGVHRRSSSAAPASRAAVRAVVRGQASWRSDRTERRPLQACEAPLVLVRGNPLQGAEDGPRLSGRAAANSVAEPRPVDEFRPRRRSAEAGLCGRVAQRDEPARLERAAARDESLEGLYAEPFRIHRPFRQTVPFVFASSVPNHPPKHNP